MINNLEHRFVESVPEQLEEGVLYVSLRFRVIIHACCCGCKNKVITPLSPVRWKMTFDGKTVSLYPSIGNWNFDCQSHYWITNDKVEWAEKWSNNKIAMGKMMEREKRSAYYSEVNSSIKEYSQAPMMKQSLINKITTWLKKLI